MNVKNSRIYIIATSVAIMFLLSLFLFLNDKQSKPIELLTTSAAPTVATSHTQTVRENVVADPITIRGGAYLFQQEDNPNTTKVHWVANTVVGDLKIANTANNTPVTTKITAPIDLANYAKPTIFRSKTDGTTYQANQLNQTTILSAKDFEFVPAFSYGIINNGVAHVGGTKLHVTYEVGDKYKETTKEVFHTFGNGVKKYKIMYATPFKVTWHGYLDIAKDIRATANFSTSVGKTQDLKAEVATKTGTSAKTAYYDVTTRSETTWKSDNPSVVSVDNNGKIKALKKGTATIQVNWKSGDFHITTKTVVTVKDTPTLDITGNLDMCFDDGSTTLTAFYSAGQAINVTNLAITKWISSDTSIATVDKGIVTFKKEGEVTITAQYQNESASVVVKINDCTVPTQPQPDPTQPTQPTAPENLPPTVEIEGKKQVQIGELVCYNAKASDPDGFIAKYEWHKGNFVTDATDTSKICGTFEQTGNHTIIVVVEDSGDLNGENVKTSAANATIEVIAPEPEAYVLIEGTFKENRKMTARPAHPYGGNNILMQLVPIVKETLTIEAVDKNNQSKIKVVEDISGNVDYMKVVNFLAKFSGEVKISRYVENSEGHSDYFERVIEIAPDLAPIADFEVPVVTYRETPNSTNYAEATIKLISSAMSYDDEIQKYTYRMKYDSDNDGSFDDEQWQVLSDSNKAEIEYKTTKVGKYLFEMEVIEKIMQETIPSFVDQTFDKATTDLRFANTDNKAIEQKIVEVDNLAPHVSISAKKAQKAEIQFDAINSPFPLTSLEGSLPYLKNLLAKENITLTQIETDFESTIQKIQSSNGVTLVLLDNGDVYSSGGYSYSQNGNPLGLGTSLKQVNRFVKVPLPKKAVDIFTNGIASQFVMEDGTVYGTGNNNDGAVGSNQIYSVNSPIEIDTRDNTSSPFVKAKKIINVSGTPMLLLENGVVKFTGRIADYVGNGKKLTSREYAFSYSNNKSKLPQKVIDIKVGGRSINNVATTIFKLENGETLGSGNNSYLQDVDYQTTFTSNPRPFKVIPQLNGVRVVNSYRNNDSRVIFELSNGRYVIESGSFSNRNYEELKFNSPISYFYEGGSFSFALLENGDLYLSGSHSLSNYTSGSAAYKGFKKVNLNGKVQTIEYNDSTSSTLLVIDGELYVIGVNRNGQLGVGHYTDVTDLTKVNLGSKITKFKNGTSNMFTVSLNQTTNLEATKKSLREVQEFYFVAGGTPTNKSLMDSVIQWNDNRGRFIEITPSNSTTNIQAFYDELAKYIIETLSKKQAYVQLDTTNSPFTQTQINEMTAYANTILDDYGLAMNTSFVGTDNIFTQKGKPMYMVSMSNSTLTKDTILDKMSDVNGYYVGITSSNNVVNEIISENRGKGTHIPISADLKSIMEQLAAYIIQTESENSVEVQFLVDSSIGISKMDLANKIDSEFKNIIAPNEIVTEYVQQADGSVLEVEKVVPSTRTLRYNVADLTSSYDYKDIRLQAKNRFVVLLTNNSLSTNQVTHLTASNLINNAHFIGISDNVQNQLQGIVDKSMKKGTILSNDAATTILNEIAMYIDEKMNEMKGKEEVFITMNDLLKYGTTYTDFELDPMIDDYWLFNHSLGFFDSETGTIQNNNQKIKNPITQFSLTGRYLPRYAAKDNPLRPFSENQKSLFDNYSKWSDEADDLILYVHNKPSAQFTFKIDGITGQYTISSTAHDIDKQLDVQQGQGLQLQKFEYRLKGERLWKKGTPPNPLKADDVYEVRNTAVDMQNETATVIKTLSRKNLPPIAEFETDKELYDVGEVVNLTNLSYDPNNDDLTAKWYVKAKNEAETSYTEFASGGYNANGTISANWDSTLTNLECQSSTLPCPYDIKLVVTDSNGLLDQMVKTIQIQMTEVIDIGIRDVEVFTAPAAEGLPVYLRLNETILVNNADNIEEARNTLVQVNVFRNGTLHQTENVLTKSLLTGHHFTIKSNGVLEKDKAYAFEFVIHSPFSEKIVVASGKDRISLNARTAEEKTVTLSNNSQEYKALLSVKRSLGQEQVNVYETITLQAAELTPTVTGLGNSLDVSIAYRLPVNQHYRLNMIAAPTVKFVYGAQLIDSYYDDATIADGKATVEAVQTVNTTNRTNNVDISTIQLSHPKVFVEKNSGHLFSEQQVANRDSRIKDTLLDGGHKLYTPIWLNRIGDYNIHYKTSALGVNQVSFMLNQTLELEGYMFLHINSNTKHKDKWLMEPVMKKNPFPNGLPNGWTEADEEWLKN